MNKKSFLKILQAPENLSENELSFIKEINQDFPYFQVSKAIYLKSLKETEDLKFGKYLKLTAAHTRNRKTLFDFINNSQNQNEKVFFNKNEIKTILAENKTTNNKDTMEHNSFVEWLEISNIKPIDRNNQNDIVDKFISEKPKINIKTNEEELDKNSKEDLVADARYMTETLAKLYLNQKNYDKAIQSYKILILKFPEKNSYFADQIKKIKSLKK